MLATNEGRVLNRNEGAALNANDVGMNKWGGGKNGLLISKIPKKVASCIWIQKRIKGAILYTNYSQKRGKVLNGTKGVLTTKEGRVLNVKEGRRSTPMKWEMDKWGGGGKMDYYFKNTKKDYNSYFDQKMY